MKKNKLSWFEIYRYILTFYFDRKYLDSLPESIRWKHTGKNVFYKFWNILKTPLFSIKQGLKYEITYRKSFQSTGLKNKIWLFITTKNNRDSLKFLLEELDDAVLIGDGSQVDKTDKFQIPFYQSIFYIYKFPIVWWAFYKTYGGAAIRYVDTIFKMIGLYEVALKSLKKYRPSTIVIANDHSEKQRAILLAGKQLDIPVVYIQHASISQFMPPLDFDLSLLEGQDAWDKYKEKGVIRGKVKLVGMPKFDSYIPFRNQSTSVQNIGICINPFDTEPYVKTLIEALAEAFPDIHLCFRPHPSDKRTFDLGREIERSTGTEGVFDFLKRQDLIIAGNSSVHLEAILLNVSSIYFEISPIKTIMQDPYGYVKNGLLPKANSMVELMKSIKKERQYRQPVFEKARYYNALVGTNMEGKSGQLAGQYIKQLK